MQKIDAAQLRQGNLGELLTLLEMEMTAVGINFYLIGAIARDVWLTALQGIEPKRITRDLDLAVLLSDKHQYALLKQRLVDTKRFIASRDNAFTLIFEDRRPVDLLPFGALTMEGGVQAIGDGLTSIRVDGFQEVFDAGTESIIVDNQTFRVCTLAGIVVLKLIAYNDRPEHRPKDIQDIRLILQHYFTIAENDIFEHHNDLFGEDDIDLVQIGARVMGRQMQPIVNRSRKLSDKIRSILSRQIELDERSIVAEWLVRDTDWTLVYAINLLRQLKSGMSDP